MAVPDHGLEKVMEMYNSELALSGLESIIFGHIGKNHVHVNIIPWTMEDYNKGKAMYQAWAKRVIALGGTVSAEHGIGKMKTALLREMYGDNGINEMLRVRKIFDPEGILNRGNLFTY
jgi:D-lactate dehydrogenase (cytochrome)